MAWDTGIDKKSAAYKFASGKSKVIRVVAGPGTGKSFGLQRRVARLLEEGQEPRKILAVTFTRTAAQDLRNEIQSVGVEGSDKVIAKTLHSFCFGLLNKKAIIERTGRFPRPMLEFEQKPMLYDIDNTFGKLRDKQKRIQAFESAWARLQSEDPGFPLEAIDKQFAGEITSWLKAHKAMLFGEMIIETFHYLRNNPSCVESRGFDHILVDEYQDLNKAEQAVIDLLASNCNLAIIGDDDQSIYSFKHAHPEGIQEFSETHPGCDAIDFDHCRRCPKHVVRMASRLISQNTNRTLGDLQAFEQNQNGIVKIAQWDSLDDEIVGLANKVNEDILSEKIKAEDVLILAPVRKIGYRIRDALVQNGINAKSYFRESAIATDELKYSFALLSLMAKPNDMVALRYLLGYGNQNYRTKSYMRLLDYATKHSMTTFEVLEKCISGELKLSNISSLLKQYKKITRKINEIRIAIEGDGETLIDVFAEDIPDNRDFRNILIEAVEEAEDEREVGLEPWLQKIHSLIIERVSFPENTSKRDHVRIMSLHASKGLSAKYVIVMSAIDELIPRLDKDSEISLEKQIEEQRRLFYVAITRCKSSDNGYPGTLIISSFVGLPGSEALGINISANPHAWRTVSASRFIKDFGETAPSTLSLQKGKAIPW
ncbi:MAG: UvrD-helicase domain-containing protein [Anaerovoracaceae bacterium]